MLTPGRFTMALENMNETPGRFTMALEIVNVNAGMISNGIGKRK
jgi:hypothetical protein